MRGHARVLLLAVALAAASGCAPTPFVYRPSGPAGVPPVPVKVVVLPFENGTDDFVESTRGPGQRKIWNLSRASFMEFIEALPPERWARELAADLAASGRFAGARFVYSREELSGDEVVVEGTLVRAYLWNIPAGQFELALKASAVRGGRPLWEARVARTNDPWNPKKLHEWAQEDMAGMFAEAGEGLAKALGARPAARSSPTGAAAAGEPFDDTIRRILEGK